MGRETGQVEWGRVRLRRQIAQEVLALRWCHASLKRQSRKVEPWGRKWGARG